jgi:alcohol dehydrogenase/propanol-preferring alcohol dehydrogenase
MRAWSVMENGQPLRQVELPEPRPVGTQVVLEVAFCGVCHSDVHIWEGHYGLGGDKKLLLKDRGVSLPLVMGHEIVGRVVDVGPLATGVRVGDLRVVYPWLGCGSCATCRAEQDHMCLTPRSIGVFQNGGYASLVIVPEPRHLIDPGALDPVVAATYACSGLTAFSAVKKTLPLPPDEPIAVVGIGGLGLSAVTILHALGHRRILALDVKAENREAALRAGASEAFDPAEGDVAPRLIAACGRGVGAVIDFVNSSTTAKAGFDALRRGGKLVQVGFFGGELNLPLPLMPLRALTVQGSYVGSPGELRELIALANGGALAKIPLRTVAPETINSVLADLRDGKVTGRVVLDVSALRIGERASAGTATA